MNLFIPLLISRKYRLVRKFLLLLFIALTSFANAQNKQVKSIWRLTIVDSVTLKGIIGVTVKAADNLFFTTDNTGKVSIDQELVGKDGLIKLSCIGYNPLIYKPEGKYPDTIKMSVSLIALGEVIVGETGKLLLASVDDSAKGGFILQPDVEIAEYIPNIQKVKGTILSVEFALLNKVRGIKNPFKVNLYTKSQDSRYPQEGLIKDSIVVYNPEGHPIVSVDVSKYHIVIPENGFFVSIQALTKQWYGNDMAEYGGQKLFKVPGIKGFFKDNDAVEDNDDDEPVIPGKKFSLIRNLPDSIWHRFIYGTDFAIGATINPE